MLKMKRALLALGLSVFWAPQASAQMKWTDKLFVNINFGLQAGSQDVETATTVEIYEEAAPLVATQSLGTEPIYLDFSAGYRVRPNLAVGIGYVNYNTESDVDFVAQIPHPIFTDQFRTVNATASGVGHSSNMLNFSAVWMWPYTDKIDFAFYGGPSVIFASQDVITGLSIAPEPGPDYSNPQITNVAVGEQSKTSFGIHFGTDMTYMYNKRYGFGGGFRYVWGSADFDGLADSVRLGGFQIIGGLRIRF
jgi:hypothetical protein